MHKRIIYIENFFKEARYYLAKDSLFNLHREYAPAIRYPSDAYNLFLLNQYWLNGINYTKEAFDEIVKTK
jgi:hypothetical protein